MQDYAIRVEDLTKIYKLYDRPKDRLLESLGLARGKVLSRDHYALRHVNFEVARGETVGIIGTNGSGKSTVLKIVTGVLNPSSGSVTVNGRISALLELGAGFNMEYTGIENIYLNGTMIGFSKEEIDAKLQDILDFADIGEFVHQPVKTYSSGMFVRLAFAVAINIEPEILIVDEALSVGDVFFQSKCYRKFEEFKKMGKTILFVSHDLSSISKYCDRVVLLNKGEKLAEGEPKKMVDLYKKLLVNQLDTQSLEAVKPQGAGDFDGEASEKQGAGDSESEAAGKQDTAGQDGANGADLWTPAFPVNPNINEYGDRQAEIVAFNILDEKGQSSNTLEKGSRCTIQMRVKFHQKVSDPIYAFTITDLKGTDITGTNSLFEKVNVPARDAGEIQEISFTQAMDMQGGEYMLSLGCTGYNGMDFVVHHRLYEACNLTIVSTKNTVGFYDTNSEVKLLNME
ncbi:MAG: ABC transporter ATP-binding protein [Eubacteriales bacterium]|nr:ABC transporter ATP-binding protein [Eubacteriales bacterium]